MGIFRGEKALIRGEDHDVAPQAPYGDGTPVLLVAGPGRGVDPGETMIAVPDRAETGGHLMPLEIWINPDCSKCRSATADLDAAGVSYVERRYLDQPPSSAELADVLHRMGLEPWDIARPKETAEAGIDLPREPTHRQEWIEAMVANPLTIQRPIITATDGTTTIARDPQTVAALLARESRP